MILLGLVCREVMILLGLLCREAMILLGLLCREAMILLGLVCREAMILLGITASLSQKQTTVYPFYRFYPLYPFFAATAPGPPCYCRCPPPSRRAKSGGGNIFAKHN